MPFILLDLTLLVVIIVSTLQVRRLRFREVKVFAQEHPVQSQNSALDAENKQKSFSSTLRPLPLTRKGIRKKPNKGTQGTPKKKLACLGQRTPERSEPLG